MTPCMSRMKMSIDSGVVRVASRKNPKIEGFPLWKI